VAATRWSMVRHQLGLAQRSADQLDPEPAARLAVVAAEVALADDDPGRARRAAEEILALDGVPAPVRCHAFEIVGRAQRLRDLAGARTAFQAALTAADEAGLAMWRLRALHELGTIDMFDHIGVERLTQARRRAEEVGAISTVATLDLQLSACYTARWQLDRCDAHGRSALEVAERLGLDQVRAKALAMLAGSASMRADVEATDHYAALTAGAAPGDEGLAGFTLASRGMAAWMDGDPAGGVDLWSRGMAALAHLPNAEPASVRALWPLVLASLGDRRAGPAIEEARRLGVGGFILNRGLIGYAEAVLAGRAGDRRRAEEVAAAAAAGFVNCETWAALARFLAAPCARADRWGQPRRWLIDAVRAFTALGLHTLAGRAERLLKVAEPNPWAADGVTDREADVLRLIGQGLANKEIAAELGLSPRTVEKHVESLLRKTGARTRVDLAVRAGTSTT
jgi:DNA-binding CsgD family transcriptional regulator